MAILYKKIYQELLNQIAQGFFKIGDKLPSEKDLCTLYGVSRITSKRVLVELEKTGYVERVRGKGTFLIKTVNKPLESINKTKDKYKGSIAIVFPSMHEFGNFSQTLEGCTKVICEHNYKPNLYFRFHNLQEVESLLQKLKREGVKGIIYYPYSLLDSYEVLNSFKYAKIPLVTIDKYFTGIDIKAVCSDNFRGGRLATEYLINLGHKKIGFISDVSLEGVSSVRDRYLGYCEALDKANISYNSNLISIKKLDIEFLKEYDEAYFIDEIKRLLRNGVTGIIAINDIVASYVIRVAKILDINIPNQLSVVGFDGVPYSEFQEIPLTSVLQDFTKMGREAASIIIDELEGRERESITSLPVSLVVRDSCLPPKK